MDWIQKVDRELFISLWTSDLSTQELCVRLNLSSSRLWLARKFFGLPTRAQAAMAKNDPTPDDIARECAAFQATWSDEEEERRRVGHRRRHWEPYYV